MITIRRGVELVTDAVVYCQLWSDVPLVLRISSQLGPAQRVGICDLAWLCDSGASSVIRQAQQEVGQRSIGVGRGGRASGCSAVRHGALELETATRGVDTPSAGGLEVIEVEVVVGEAVLGGMLALGPTHVHVGGELVVAEQEWIGAVGVAHRGPAGEHQPPLTRIVGAKDVRPS